jgi:hypothetical protein
LEQRECSAGDTASQVLTGYVNSSMEREREEGREITVLL